jgi:hypothetical protein
MKAKHLLWVIPSLTLLLSSESFARRGYPYLYPHYGSNYGRTHYVRPSTNRNGSYVHRHPGGNPRSNVHCHNNICY